MNLPLGEGRHHEQLPISPVQPDRANAAFQASCVGVLYQCQWPALLRPLHLWNVIITLSGFSQDTFQINHKGGQINRPRQPDPQLINSELECCNNSNGCHLVHKQNLHEVHRFKHFCNKLGTKSSPSHSDDVSVNKMLDGLEEIPPELGSIYSLPAGAAGHRQQPLPELLHA